MPDALTPHGLEHFGEVAAAHVGDDKVPGLVALVAHGEQVHVEVLGSLSIGGPAVRRDSLFRIASTTKPVTGAATLALIQEAMLTFDEPVDRLLPELANRRVLRRMDGPLDDTIPAERAIIVRDLLTFTFGFGMIMEMFMATHAGPGPTRATRGGRPSEARLTVLMLPRRWRPIVTSGLPTQSQSLAPRCDSRDRGLFAGAMGRRPTRGGRRRAARSARRSSAGPLHSVLRARVSSATSTRRARGEDGGVTARSLDQPP